MKTLTIFIILLLNCSPAKNVLLDAYQDSKQTEQIYGSWGICKRKVYDKVFLSNVCNTMSFDENGKGQLLISDKILSNFKWKIDTEKLQFTFNTPTDQKEFLSLNTEYSYKRYYDGELEFLELVSKDKVYTYYLSRLKSGK